MCDLVSPLQRRSRTIRNCRIMLHRQHLCKNRRLIYFIKIKHVSTTRYIFWYYLALRDALPVFQDLFICLLFYLFILSTITVLEYRETSNRNEYHGYLLGWVKAAGGRCWQPDRLHMLRASTSWNPKSPFGPVTGYIHLSLEYMDWQK